jgi:hypothetical protein
MVFEATMALQVELPTKVRLLMVQTITRGRVWRGSGNTTKAKIKMSWSAKLSAAF